MTAGPGRPAGQALRAGDAFGCGALSGCCGEDRKPGPSGDPNCAAAKGGKVASQRACGRVAAHGTPLPREALAKPRCGGARSERAAGEAGRGLWAPPGLDRAALGGERCGAGTPSPIGRRLRGALYSKMRSRRHGTRDKRCPAAALRRDENLAGARGTPAQTAAAEGRQWRIR